MKTQARKRRALSVPEAAEELGISRGSAFAAVKRGEIPSIRIGKRLLVPVAALDSMLSEVRQEEASEGASG